MEQQAVKKSVKKTSVGTKVTFEVRGSEIVVLTDGREWFTYSDWAEAILSEVRFPFLGMDQPRVVGPFIQN